MPGSWVLIGAAALLSLACASPTPAGSTPPGGEPLAVVAGQPVEEAEILNAAAGQLRELRMREYEVKRAALDRIIDQRLLEAEAKTREITAAQLLREIDAAVADPSKREVESYYLAQTDHIDRPLRSMVY